MKIPRILKHPALRASSAVFATKRPDLLPGLAALRGYGRAEARRDWRAAFFVALLAIPQGLALATIAGLPPEHGAYASIVGLALGALFSGSRHVSFGPSVTMAVLLSSVFFQLRIPAEQRAGALAVLLLLAGALLIAAAWFRFALLSRFISRSVTTGFMIAAGILVVASQLRHVLGLTAPETGVFVPDLLATFAALGDVRWPPLLVGALTAGVYLALGLRGPSMPAAFAAMVAGGSSAWFLGEAGFAVPCLGPFDGSVGPILPTAMEFGWIGPLGGAALAIALLSHLEVSLIGRSLAARAGLRFDAHQHLFGLGMAGLGGAFCAGMPVSVSLSRTRINWRQRAATPLAGVAAGLIALAVYAVVAPFQHHIPRAALAALAMILATEIVSRHYVRIILRASRADAVVLFSTVAAGLLFRLDVALYVGAGLSIVFFLRKVGVPELSEHGLTQDGQLARLASEDERPRADISIVHVEGDLFFGAAEIFLEQARRVCEDPRLRIIVLRMRNAHHLDATCALAIEELLRFARDHDRHIIVSGAHRGIYRVFRNSGLLDRLGRENFFMDIPSNPNLSTRHALKRARELLGGTEANIRIYVDPAKEAARTEAR